MEAEFAFGVSSSCKGSWVQRRVRTRVERLMLRRSRAEREGGSLVEGCTLTKNGFGSQEPALWEESRVVGGRTSEKRHQSEGREATLLVLLLYVRSEYSGPSGGSWVGVLAASSKDITRGRRTAASAAVVCMSGWLLVRDERLFLQRGGSEHCWASSNLPEPTRFVRTKSGARAVGRGSQAEASDPGQSKLRLRLSKVGRELGSISSGTASGASSNSWFGERLGEAGVASSNV